MFPNAVHDRAAHPFRSLIAAGVLSSLALAGQAHAVTNEELAKKLEALEAQNAALQVKVDKLEAAQAAQASQASQAQPVGSAVAHEPAAAATPSESAQSTTVSSYGEIGFTRPLKAADKTNVSVGRAVIFVGHQFDEATKMIGEFEWENAITSGQDSGEAEVEQLYVEHQFQDGLRATAGLYLMPAGLVNQNHEPTAYYGVFRPDVDTMIIPSTWREVGLGLSGSTDIGVSWDAGVTTDQNLSKWDPASDEGLVRGPLQAIHQEGQFATARDLAEHVAVNWRGPGMLLGASAYTGNIGQHQPGFLGNSSRLLLWEVHGRYEVQGWDLAAEYARGTISNTEALNTNFIENGPANPTLVPSLFYGGYGQIAYRFAQGHYYRLTPFVRYEIFNTAAEFGALNSALSGPAAAGQPDEKELTAGASFFIGEGVVLKADYRHYQVNQYPSAIPFGFRKGNSVNFGLGYSF